MDFSLTPEQELVRDTVRTFSRNDRQLHGIPGAIAVFHTNTRVLLPTEN